MVKQRIHLRLTPKTLRQLEDAALAPGVTKSGLVEQAIRHYFDPALAEDRDAALFHRLDGFDLRQGVIERDTALIAETLGQFVLYWLTRTDPLPDGARDVAHELGQQRFDYFINQVARKLGTDDALAARLFPPEQAE